ncbi:MAG: hypothetical protein KAY50_08240 [Chitinophagaceae bacterium]|nr:hypothetical protein [Chitinophagaceae bacterium]
MTNKLQLIAKPGIGSGWTNIAEHFILTSTLYFQSAAAVGGRNTNSTPAQSPARCTSPYWTSYNHSSIQEFANTTQRTKSGTFARHTKPTHKSKPCKRACLVPTQSLPTPAYEYSSSFVRHFSKLSLLNTKAHPPPNYQNAINSTFGHP